MNGLKLLYKLPILTGLSLRFSCFKFQVFDGYTQLVSGERNSEEFLFVLLYIFLLFL